MAGSDRRDFLRLTGGAVAAIGTVVLMHPRWARAAALDSDRLVDLHSFKVEIEGITQGLEVQKIQPGDLKVKVELTERPGSRAYTYGSHEYGDLTLVVQPAAGMTKVQEWADHATKRGGSGDGTRRDISVTILDDEGTQQQKITWHKVLPTSTKALRGDRLELRANVKSVSVESAGPAPRSAVPTRADLEVKIAGSAVAVNRIKVEFPEGDVVAAKTRDGSSRLIQLQTFVTRGPDPIDDYAEKLTRAGVKARPPKIVVTRKRAGTPDIETVFERCQLVKMSFSPLDADHRGPLLRDSWWATMGSAELDVGPEKKR